MWLLRRPHVVAWFCASVVAGLSLFGQSLHFLPGLGHGCGLEHGCSAHSFLETVESPRGCHNAARDHVERADLATECAVFSPGDLPNALDGDGTDCPICQFFSFAQSPLVATCEVVGAAFVVGDCSGAEAVRYSAPAVLLYQARAPPSPA